MMGWRIAVVGATLCLASCHRADEGSAAVAAGRSDASSDPSVSTCPTTPIPASVLPGTEPVHDKVDTWLTQPTEIAADAQLHTREEIDQLNARFEEVKGAWRDPGARTVGTPEQVQAAIEERLAYLEQQRALHIFVEGQAGSLEIARGVVATSSAVDHQRLVISETQLWCSPFSSGLYKPPIDRAFDRNACASLHPGEKVRVLRRGAKGEWLHVHAGHTVGWVHNAVLTDRLSPDELDAWDTNRRLFVLDDTVTTADGFAIRLGVSVPIIGDDDAAFRILVPSADGVVEGTVVRSQSVSDGPAVFTRETLLRVALSQLGAPYGWGGTGGGRDCSRFLRDVFYAFGVQLGRHSSVQAELGARSIDVSALGEAEKRDAIDAWAARGVVILYMPGHVMLYLGRAGEDQFAVSSISEFATPCEGGEDTVHRIDRVAVGTLEIGRGAERRSFIERISRLAVFGPGLAEL